MNETIIRGSCTQTPWLKRGYTDLWWVPWRCQGGYRYCDLWLQIRIHGVS